MIAILWVWHGIKCGVKGRSVIVLFKYIRFVGLRKCLYDHYLANKAYFSDITVKNIYESFTQKMAVKANWN